MIRITPKYGEPIAVTLRRFKKICEREGIIKEVKKHSYFETKNQIRRRKRLKAIRKSQVENADDSQFGRSQSSSAPPRPQKRW